MGILWALTNHTSQFLTAESPCFNHYATHSTLQDDFAHPNYAACYIIGNFCLPFFYSATGPSNSTTRSTTTAYRVTMSPSTASRPSEKVSSPSVPST